MYSSDKLTIDTPEQVPLEFHLAGIGSRFLALAFDTVLQIAGWLGLLVIYGVILSGHVPDQARTWIVATFVILAFLIYWGYYAILEAVWNGQTPGKRLVRIRVIKDTGRPITVYESISRNLLRLVDQLPGMYGVGIISAMLSKDNKRLGDYVAGTVVVHEKPLEEVQPGWETVTTSAPAPPLSNYDARRLSVEELQLIEAFLLRRYDLSPELRQYTADQIASRIMRRLNIALEPGTTVETMLETLARERRDAARFR